MAPAFSYLPSHPIMLRLFLAIFKILLFNPTNSQGWVAIGIMAILVRHLEVYLQFSLYTNVTNLLYTSYLVPYIQIYTKSFFLTRFISSIPASCPQSRTHRRFSTEKQALFFVSQLLLIKYNIAKLMKLFSTGSFFNHASKSLNTVSALTTRQGSSLNFPDIFLLAMGLVYHRFHGKLNN